MDCLRAQMLVSERLDHQPVDAAELEIAKDHCRSCPECARFVRALVALRDTPVPEPPAALVGRVMSAIEPSPVAAGPPAEQPVGTFSLAPDTAVAPRKRALREHLLDPRNRRAVVGWASAAAAVLIFTGVMATAGIRILLAPPETPTAADLAVASVTEGGVVSRDDMQKESAVTAAPQASQAATAPPYVVVAGTVYRSSGPASGVDPASLKRLGSTSSSLDSSGSATAREVMTMQDSATVYILDDAGAWQKFDRVTRSYRSSPFALQSGPIGTYGQWPTLPGTVTRPTAADGSPAHSDAGTDDSGVTVFGPNGVAVAGFLVAPGTSGGDPAAGNPDWTYWAPVR